MSAFNNIPAGKDIPNDFNVVIEIPAQGEPVKYEVDKDSGLLLVDRFMPSAMHYPCNYGFIPNTLSNDGDPTDVLVLAPNPIQPGAMVRCRPIGILQMTDEAGEDSKVLAIPIEKVCAEYSHIKSLSDISQVMLDRIVHFFERYKELEPNKWVKVTGWEDRVAAEKEIVAGVAQFQARKDKATV